MVLNYLFLKHIIKKERLNIEAQSTEINKFFHNSRNFKIIKGYKNG